MSSDDIAISVEGVGKRYEMYESPRHRLKQFFVPTLNRIVPGHYTQQYKEFWALRDINFQVRRGEAVGIVGRNGSGKSTLLQIITGTLSPTTGTVRTVGRIAALLELGSGFNVDYTGRENVYLNGALLGLSTAEVDAKFDDIAAFADIGEHLEQPVKTYSSGMLVRLAFAVQVQLQPDILIVDEALAVGDALFQKRCFQQIERLVGDGVSLLFVSHDQESVRTITNRALLLKDGRQLEWGTSSEVILSYRRLLHEEEARYFSALTEQLLTSARKGTVEQPEVVSTLAEPVVDPTLDAVAIDVAAACAVGACGISPGGDDSKGDITAPPAQGGIESPTGQGAETGRAVGRALAPRDTRALDTLPPEMGANQLGHRSAKMDFGGQLAVVRKVVTLDENGEHASVFYTGQRLTIRVDCESRMDATKLNVGIRIRNKEGFKIYSWGTLNQDMERLAETEQGEVFWSRQFHAGDEMSVTFDAPCDLGVNLYEIQAAVSYEETPDYYSQRILHWVDEAAFFQVLMKRDEHFFGGVIDMKMRAVW